MGANLRTPLRRFLRTETGSAAVLLTAAVAALAWANIDVSSYDAVRRARLSVELNGTGVGAGPAGGAGRPGP